MSELDDDELLKILSDSIEDNRMNLRDLKNNLDMSQDEFDERMYKLNKAEHQIRQLIEEDK